VTVTGMAASLVPPELAAAGDDLAAAALTLARRLDAGATLWCVAPGADHHARHVAVEFVHPVVVGKRSLPAVAITDADPVGAARLLVKPGDVIVVIGDGADPRVAALLGKGRQRRVATILLATGEHTRPEPPDHMIPTGGNDGDEGSVLAYHLLWELTHVVLEHPGLLQPGAERPATGTESTAFLYPFITADEQDVPTLLRDLATSARHKMEASFVLRAETLRAEREAVTVAARAMAGRFLQGGHLLTFGNGGSATDADAVAGQFRRPPYGRPLPARSLVDDQSVLTALANDVGFDLVFARQVIAHGRPSDIALAVSTSGGSTNVLAGLAEARRRGLLTVGLCGYDGGAMATGGDVEHCLVVRSDSVHRIQEAQDALLESLWLAVQAELAAVLP
jgi:D-sedoheptulose 7-phosphate isomerase